MAQSQKDSGLTLTVLGCGVMGVSILSGIMAALPEAKSQHSSNSEEVPPRLPTRFIACDARKEAEDITRKALGHYDCELITLTNQNLKGAQEADVILLSCKPHIFKDILGENGMKEALAGKLIVSILAGVTGEQIEEFLYGDEKPEDACRIVRVMPNTASFVQESMSVIANTTPPLPDHYATLVKWMFSRIGRVVNLPPAMMDVCTALCGSGPAFVALVIEAMADGAVAMGLPRAEANLMATQVVRGTTGLVLNGEHPAILREKVSTPGGCTIGGLLALEEGAVRASVSRAVREATVVASQLGQGVKNVNGTRH